MFRLRRGSPGPVRLTLYSKPGCHLCEDARTMLEHLAQRYRLVIDEIDIRADPQTFRAYDIRIPVIVFDEGTTLEAPIKEREIRDAVKRAARAR
jgi:glutaredoxin